MRSLKRYLVQMGLSRRKNQSPIIDVASFVLENVEKSGFQNGYRWMHQACINEGFTISRHSVAALMAILDPVGTSLRAKHRLKRRNYYAKGPNYLWHLDSYDKLKKYGLCINGCIDGFSRQLIWLYVTYSTNNPKIIAGHYCNAVKTYGGCPMKIRGDMGTENSYVSNMQEVLSGGETFYYGRSTSNQRIEMFWRHLRRLCGQRWMDMLGKLVEEGYFDGGTLDVNIMQHVFMPILQVGVYIKSNWCQISLIESLEKKIAYKSY